MAQYVHQYVTELLEKQDYAGNMLGVGIYGVDRQLYAVNLTLLTIIGTLMKTISEVAPAVTDQVWQDRLSHALDSSGGWPAAVLNQVKPGTTPPV